ncbi:unnamed protein product [Camellia sinensis]
MENLQSRKILSSLYLLLFHLLQFSSLSLLSSSYTLPDKYFINCGSDSNSTLNRRNFVGDVNSTFSSAAGGQTSAVSTTNSSTTIELYRTARIFKNASSYELEISQIGTYTVRFHFYAFNNLSDAQFNVSASGFSLLSNFTSLKNSPEIKEFLFTIDTRKFTIDFKPSKNSSFAFVNALEVFLVPDNFIVNSMIRVSSSGSNSTYDGLLSRVLHPVHRINVGGGALSPENDTLWRNWVPDDGFLYSAIAAKNSSFYSNRPNYQEGGATDYIAPDLVYKTAKEMNIDPEKGSTFFNITWNFNVSKNVPHLVRVHFCDIISSSNDIFRFNLYVFDTFSQKIDPYEVIPQLAAPFYKDFVVDSDDFGFINVSIGPRQDSNNQTAFLNGLEIMEIIGGLSPDLKKLSKTHLVFVIVGSVLGGVASVFLFIAVFVVRYKFRKAKPVENSDWQTIPSPVCNLNLGLKLSLSEIQYATKNFNSKLMIGEGGFGKVYRGTLRSGEKVAVKRSQPGHGQGLPEFQTEIKVLSKIRHRHLVSLIGYCDEESEMILVYEFMQKGTLRSHLYNSNEDLDKTSSESKLSWNRRLEICIGTAKGLHYLHRDRGIIHRDVKSTNILLDDDYVAKVADFGLSRLEALDQTHVSTEVKGSYGYLDPEYFKFFQLTQKSDVYSFGVVLLEVLCARPAINKKLPWEQVNLAAWGLSCQKKGLLWKIVDPLIAGNISPNSLRTFGEIVDKCLKEYGVERPSMADVLWDLEYALKLQQTATHREPHEDSTTDVSWVLPVPSVHRLPSDSMTIDEDGVTVDDFGDTSADTVTDTCAFQVFSQLRIHDAR